MITITYGKLLGIIIILCLIMCSIIVTIKEYQEAKLESEKDKFVKKEIDEFEKNKGVLGSLL